MQEKFKYLKKLVWKNPIYFLGFGFGSGLIKFAPGTWGTLATLPIYMLLVALPLPLYTLALIGLFFLGVSICNRISYDLEVQDYKGIVYDEMVGFLITMYAVPLKWFYIVLGFLLFRLFDIWKPGIIKVIDKQIKDGMGIMLDDVLAGIYACIVLHAIQWVY